MRALLVTLHGLALAGCASSIVHPTPYPTDWPERGGLTDCQITGIYQDFGVLRSISVTAPEQRYAHLSRMLRDGNTGRFEDRSNPDVHLFLHRDAPMMRVGGEPSAEIEYLRGEDGVVCESDGALTLRFRSATPSTYRHAVITLWNGMDGSLIARMDLRFTDKGPLGLLPDSYEVYWFRFLRAEP